VSVLEPPVTIMPQAAVTDVGARPPGWRPPLADVPPAPAEPKGLVTWSTVLVLLAIGAGIVALKLSESLAGHGKSSNDLINDGLTLTVLVYVVVGGLVAGFIAVNKISLRWHEGDPVRSAGMGVVRGLLLSGLVTAVFSSATHRLHGDDRFSSLLSEGNGVRILVLILLLVVAAPLVEETLFRGLLLESWRRFGWVALVVSAIAFAAWHLIGSAILYYWLMGLALGRIYVRRGLIGSMAAHATFNSVVLVVTIASVSGSGHNYDTAHVHAHTPPSWHSLSASQTSDLHDELVLTGPSGSSVEIATVAHPPIAKSALAADAHSTLTAALGRLGGDPTDTEVVDLPLGTTERGTVEANGHSVEVYVTATTDRTYITATNTASSKTARNQIPGILNSLRTR